MENKIYNQSGKEAGKITLPEAVFGLPENMDLIHQVVISMQSNARTNVAHAKDRSEVRGGGKKPWKQKGTGRARHGSSRSPIWVGGGVTHGPTNERNYTKKINKKMKTKALFTALSGKLNDNEILFVDSLDFTEAKTAKASEIFKALAGIKGYEALGEKKQNTALITTLSKDENVYKSFGNFGNIAIEEVRNLNPVDILTYKYLIVVNPEESVKFLETKLA
ncbi:50S ribosomal protein L4 [Patescibacteria group bacterium]